MKELKKDISIIIVNWNAAAYLTDCIKSIYRSVKKHTFEILLVDNASTDNSLSLLNSKFSDILIIENKENLGFSRANNQAIAKSRGELVLLLNPDTVIIDDAIDSMAGFIMKSDIAAIGPKLLNTDNSYQASTAGSFPSLRVIVNEAFGLMRVFPGIPFFRGQYLRMCDGSILDVDWLSGACLMVKRDIIDKVGYLDENFFMYFEDQEWCCRIKNSGSRVVYYPLARVIHHGFRSILQQDCKKIRKNKLSFKEYIKNFNGKNEAFLAYNIYMLGLFLRLILAVAVNLFRDNDKAHERVEIIKKAFRVGKG